MTNITVQFDQITGRIKSMHAVNNGPIKASDVEQTRGNFPAYKAACIPYARNHDASFFSAYGGEHTVDVHNIFPDFNANPYDERSYDFTLTDEYTQTIVDAGTQVYYRLGNKIEHWTKKYGTIVPADFYKWAVICEHIIRHYNEGWANGFHHNIIYWEIWNEPDGMKTNGDKPNWSGTQDEYYELYAITATHLKKRFPHLKIGGPAMSYIYNNSWPRNWLDGFLENLTAGGRRLPLDFFSFHIYSNSVEPFVRGAQIIRQKLDEIGYTETEIHINEWNYVENFTSRFIASIEHIIGMRGAAFSAAVMLRCQNSSLDMLMYYDARPSAFNGMFDFYTYRPLKGYYPFLMFSKLYELGDAVLAESDSPDVYVLGAVSDTTKAVMLSYYTPADNAPKKDICLHLDPTEPWNIFLLDKDHTMENIPYVISEDGKIHISVENETVLLIHNDHE